MEQTTKKVSCIKIIYEIIDYVADVLKREFEIDFYLINENSKDNIRFSINRLSKFISKNTKQKSKNRFFLFISIDDSKEKKHKDSHKLLENTLKEIKENFWKSKLSELLERYSKKTTIKIFYKANNGININYVIILISLPKESSIEVIISTHKLSNLIQKDETGEPIEYSGKIYECINQFENGIKNK